MLYKLIKLTVTVSITLVFACTQAYIFHVIIYKNSLNQEIVLYGDLHNIYSKKQVSILQAKFIELRNSNLINQNKIAIYHEGFGARKIFEKKYIINSNKIVEETLNFIHNFSLQNKNLFRDIENRHFASFYDKLYEFAKNKKVDQKLLEETFNDFWHALDLEISNIEKQIIDIKSQSTENQPLIKNLEIELNILKKFYEPIKFLSYFDLTDIKIKAEELLANYYSLIIKFSKCFDINFLIKICQNKNLKNIIFAGGWHIENIAQILEKSNYNKVYEKKLSKQELQKLLNGYSHYQVRELTSEDFEQISKI